ncbi:MAG TPA: hypothetical protein VIS57_13155 [Xanthomonadales bacterium]
MDLPLIGEYFGDVKDYVTAYAENKNYKEDFAEMNKLLRDINENMQNDSIAEQSP